MSTVDIMAVTVVWWIVASLRHALGVYMVVPSNSNHPLLWVVVYARQGRHITEPQITLWRASRLLRR